MQGKNLAQNLRVFPSNEFVCICVVGQLVGYGLVVLACLGT